MKSKFIFTILFLSAFNFCIAQQIKVVKIEDVISYIKEARHPVVVDFWATWCAPCAEEIPWFQKAVKDFDTANVELVLVSLDFEKNYTEVITKFAAKKNLNATIFWLNETNADHFCAAIDSNWFGTIPVTLFVNNKTGYRKFYDDQVPEKELYKIVGEMVKE